MVIPIENCNRKWWDSFFHLSPGLNSLPGSCVTFIGSTYFFMIMFMMMVITVTSMFMGMFMGMMMVFMMVVMSLIPGLNAEVRMWARQSTADTQNQQ